MRNTSFGLGLAATIIVFIVAIILIIVSVFFSAARHMDWKDVSDNFDDVEIIINNENYSIDIDNGNYNPGMLFGLARGAILFVAGCNVIAGVLGIIGTCITKKKRSVAAGVMLIIAAVLSLPWGFLAFALFIPAGILAFLEDKNKTQQIPQPPQ